MKWKKLFGNFLIILGIYFFIDVFIVVYSATYGEMWPIVIPIKENMYYLAELLPLISNFLLIILSTISVSFALRFRKKVLNKNFYRFSVFYAFGSILSVISNFFSLIFRFNTFSPFPHDEWLWSAYENYAVLSYQFSLVDTLIKIIGFYLLVRAWGYFTKSFETSSKLQKSAVYMRLSSILALFITIYSIFPQLYDLRSFENKNIGEIPYFETGNGNVLWALGLMVFSVLFSIGYILVGIRLRSINYD